MSEKRWICAGLDKEQVCFLDAISKNCRFSGGRKLCRTSIIRAVLKAVKGLDIDISKVKSEEELRNRILLSFKEKC